MSAISVACLTAVLRRDIALCCSNACCIIVDFRRWSAISVACFTAVLRRDTPYAVLMRAAFSLSLAERKRLAAASHILGCTTAALSSTAIRCVSVVLPLMIRGRSCALQCTAAAASRTRQRLNALRCALVATQRRPSRLAFWPCRVCFLSDTAALENWPSLACCLIGLPLIAHIVWPKLPQRDFLLTVFACS